VIPLPALSFKRPPRLWTARCLTLSCSFREDPSSATDRGPPWGRSRRSPWRAEAVEFQFTRPRCIRINTARAPAGAGEAFDQFPRA